MRDPFGMEVFQTLKGKRTKRKISITIFWEAVFHFKAILIKAKQSMFVIQFLSQQGKRLPLPQFQESACLHKWHTLKNKNTAYDCKIWLTDFNGCAYSFSITKHISGQGDQVQGAKSSD